MTAPDLYRIFVENSRDAEVANASGVDALMAVTGGYLVLADKEQASRLAAAGIDARLIELDIDRRRLAIDTRLDKAGANSYPAVFEEGALRLVRADPAMFPKDNRVSGLAPIRTRNIKIEFRDRVTMLPALKSADIDLELDSLIDLVSRDSLESYSYALQAMPNRAAGSQGSNVCKNWLEAKFAEFGYDSVVVDTFFDYSWWGDPVTGHNVFACKPGSTYPLDYIIIGAHRDAVATSPGADDNGSGVAAVMELARILKNVDTKMTFIFALFDAEEAGLLGSWAYASEAAERGDRIVFMLNMDMIANRYNDQYAKLYYGTDDSYAQLWARLADSLAGVNITGIMSGSSGGSDHLPFAASGYGAIFVHEYLFSTVYHSPRDSTAYMDFDYFTRMTKASLGTAYYVDATVIPPPTLIITPASDFPAMVHPDSTVVVSIHVSEYADGILVPSNVMFRYRINGGPMMTVPVNDLGSGYFGVELPPLECLDRIDYLFSVGEPQSGTFISYPDFDTPARAIKATALVIAFEDDFEDDKGWTVSGTASAGHWERSRAGSNSALPKSDYDGSSRCYLTDHNFATDVDDGMTILTSPSVDLSHAEATVEYARWYANDLGASAYSDVMRICLYHGTTRLTIDSAGPVASYDDGWIYRRYRINDLIDPVDPLRVRFEVSDYGFDSEVEAAVDAVRIIAYTERPWIVTDSCPDAAIDEAYSCQMEAVVCASPVEWSDKYGSLDGTGLTLSSDGILSGTPIDTGVIILTALAVDALGVTNEKEFAFHSLLPFLCGDADRDELVNISDAVFIVNYVFKNGPEPYPLDIADVNADGAVNVGDAVSLIKYIFSGGAPPACP